MSRLTKHDVEALLTALDTATSGPLEELTIARSALVPALQVALDVDTPDWGELIDAAAEQGAWPDDRRQLLREADDPSAATDQEALLWAVWDLVTELNERRTIEPEAE